MKKIYASVWDSINIHRGKTANECVFKIKFYTKDTILKYFNAKCLLQ